MLHLLPLWSVRVAAGARQKSRPRRQSQLSELVGGSDVSRVFSTFVIVSFMLTLLALWSILDLVAMLPARSGRNLGGRWVPIPYPAAGPRR
jgi:hypothetical protein